MFLKRECTWRQQSPNWLFLGQRSYSRSQGHWRWCNLKQFHHLSMNAKYEAIFSYRPKCLTKIKGFFLPQTDRQRDRANTRCPKLHSGAQKIRQYIYRISGNFRVGKFWWKGRLEGVFKNFHRVLFRIFKDSQWRRIVCFIFRCVYFVDFLVVVNSAKIKPMRKIPDIQYNGVD